MINRALALLIFVLCLAAPAAAAELDEAVAAAHRGEYAAALKRLSPLAAKGDARAQFDVGFMHAYGWGFPRNPADAIEWYRKAAEQGLPVAQHYLGLAYVNGEGLRPDEAEAAQWFARAAAQGYASAEFMLGLMMLDGRGVRQDAVQGYAWIVMAGVGGVSCWVGGGGGGGGRAGEPRRSEAGIERGAARAGAADHRALDAES